MKRLFRCLGWLAILGVPAVVHAVDMPAALDLAIPESPAAAAVSGNAETVLKPSTPREFAASLLNVVDRKGKFSPGVSAEVSPYLLTNGTRQIDGYQETGIRAAAFRSLVRTQLSLATGVADEKTGKAQKIAWGIRVPLFDYGDTRLDPVLSNCFMAIPPPKFDDNKPPEEQATEEVPADVKAAVKKCYDVARAHLWNASSFVAAASLLYSDQGTSKSDLKRDGRILWLSYALPLGPREQRSEKIFGKNVTYDVSSGQLIVQGKATRGAILAGDEPLEQRRYDANAAAARLRWGSERLNVSLSGSHERRKFDIGDRRESARVIAGGFEGRLQKDLWLRLSVGSEHKTASGNDPFASLVFSWSTESEPSLDPRPKK